MHVHQFVFLELHEDYVVVGVLQGQDYQVQQPFLLLPLHPLALIGDESLPFLEHSILVFIDLGHRLHKRLADFGHLQAFAVHLHLESLPAAVVLDHGVNTHEEGELMELIHLRGNVFIRGGIEAEQS